MDASNRVFDNRPKGARWCLAVEANVGHAISKANEIIIPFFEAVLASGFDTSQRPEGFGIDLEKMIIIPAGNPERSVKYSIWMPTEEFGPLWRKFIAKPKT